MKFKFTIWIFILFTVLTGCEEMIERPISPAEMNLVVVEGVITNERMRHLVKLTRPYDSQNQTPLPASGATITIEAGNQSVTLEEFPSGSGLYYTPELRAATGVTHRLSIFYQGHVFVAEDHSVPVEPLQPLEYRKADGGYRLIGETSGQDPNYVDHRLVWTQTPQCTSAGACEGKVVFYDLKTIGVNEIFKPDKQEFTFPGNTIVVRKKFSVSPAYRNFLREMLSETEWRGGLFDVQRANVPTNLSQGAVGFFAVSTVVGDTTVVN
jgi:hypothetical protein